MKVAVVCSSNQNRSMEAQNILSKKGFDVKSYGTGSVIKLPGAGPNQPNVYQFGTSYDEILKDLTTKDQQLVCEVMRTWAFYRKRRGSKCGVVVQAMETCRSLSSVKIIIVVADNSPLVPESGSWSISKMKIVFQHCNKTLSTPYTQNGILHMLDRNRRIKKGPERFQDTNEQFDVIFTVEERIYDSVVEVISTRGNVSCTPVQIINLEVKDNHEEATLGAFLILELCEMMRDSEDLEDEIEEIIQEFEMKNSRTLLHTVLFY